MGGHCCISRKDSEKSDINLDVKANRIAIALEWLMQDQCFGLEDSLAISKEISQNYALKHSCCYFSPNYLHHTFSIIEFQSQGKDFCSDNLSSAFQSELQYLIDELLIDDKDNFGVIILINSNSYSDQSFSYPLGLKKTTCRNSGIVNYIIHDIFTEKQKDRNQIYNCKETTFNSLEKLNAFLNTFSVILEMQSSHLQWIQSQQEDSHFKSNQQLAHSINNISQTSLPHSQNLDCSSLLSIKLLTFQKNYDKSETYTDSELSFLRDGQIISDSQFENCESDVETAPQ